MKININYEFLNKIFLKNEILLSTSSQVLQISEL